jgi:hypothetical protein
VEIVAEDHGNFALYSQILEPDVASEVLMEEIV